MLRRNGKTKLLKIFGALMVAALIIFFTISVFINQKSKVIDTADLKVNIEENEEIKAAGEDIVPATRWGGCKWWIDSEGWLHIVKLSENETPESGFNKGEIGILGSDTTVPWYDYRDSITTISVGEDNRKVTVKKDNSTRNMFRNCSNAKKIILNNFDTTNAVSMEYMFYGCNSLTEIDGLSGLNTSKTENMSYMFFRCSSLSQLNLSHFNTSEVTTMKGMFYGCSSLNSLNISNFNTLKVEDMSRMFDSSEIIDLNIVSFIDNIQFYQLD